MNKPSSYFYLFFVILAWASTPTITKILIKSLTALQIAFYMLLIATITLFFILLFKNKIHLLKNYNKTDLLTLLSLGFIGIFLHNFLFTLGYKYIPAAEANVLNYLWPVLVVLFSFLILKEKLTIKKSVAILLGFIGTYLIITQGRLIPLFTNLKGDIIMIGSASAWALFSVFGKKLKYEDYSSMFYYMLSGLFFLTIMMFYNESFILPTTNQLLGLLYLGIITKALAFTFWFISVKELGTAKTASWSYLSPFLAFIFINIFIGEAIHWYYIAALILIIGGVLLQNRK